MMKSVCFSALSLLLLLQQHASSYEIGCIYPPNMPDPITAQDMTIQFGALVQMKLAVETPVAVHAGLVSAMCGTSCLAMHDLKVKNPITGKRPLLFAPKENHNAWAIAMCSLQCHVNAVGIQHYQPLIDKWDANITSYWHPDLQFLQQLNRAPTTEDLFQAVQVVSDNEFHPYIMGQVALAEIVAFFLLQDGWNGDGSRKYDYLNKKIVRCKRNCMPYSDLYGYVPRNNPPGGPWSEETKYNVTGNDMYWQPLLEDDGYGYFSRQQHVMPHLATTAVPILDPNLRNRTVAAPDYQYYEEALQVIEEMAQSASDIDRKVKIQVFDNKFFVRGLAQHGTKVQFKEQHSYQKHLLFVLGLSMAEDDGVVLAWTEKLRHDLVRPTTVIQRWGDDKLMTYGGGNGPVEVPARDFEAFIRVMPHSEFPSGSACLCTTYREFTDAFTQQWYGGILEGDSLSFGAGSGGFTINCNKTVDEELKSGGCSKNAHFVLESMTELEEVCGQSRLWGGMHFSKSVPAGHELCEGLGNLAVDKVTELYADSDFGGNEYFEGDEGLPACTDPAYQDVYVNGGGGSVVSLNGEEEVSMEGVSSAVGMIGGLSTVALALVVGLV